MKGTNLVRWGALAAMASGALWIAGGLLHLAYPQDPPGALVHYLNYLGTALFSAAYLGMLGGLVGLHARQMDSYGRLGRAGFFLGFAGTALAFVGQATSVIFPHNDALGWLFGDPGFGFMAGIVFTSLGLLMMGVATVRAGVPPRWFGFGLVTVVGSFGIWSVRGFRGGRPHLAGTRVRAQAEREPGGRPQRVCGSTANKGDGMKRVAVLLVVAAVLLGSCGAQGQDQGVGETRNEARSIKLEDVRSVRAHLTMGAGELKVGGAADALMERDFSYNVADRRPQIDYEVSGEKGDLTVKHGSGDDGRLGGGARNEWDLRFNDGVPTDLVVKLGAGESDLDLDSLALTGLDLEMGAGETRVDLTGDYARDFDASIEGGVGGATVLVPSEVDVRVRAEGGLGKIDAEGFQREGEAYVNDAYGDSDVSLNVDVHGGVGAINLEVV